MHQRTDVLPPNAALAELLPSLSTHEALTEANRCLFCYDAPCTHACPTHIDIPRFIKKIATENLLGSAKTILESNLLGATCSRVCPVQELCEGACVLGSEHKPIMIGRLQRFAMDYVYERQSDVFPQVRSTTRRIAVIGAGAAGLSCAGELARRGHAVTIFERRALPGGLSTYGIIALREPLDVAIAETDMIRRLGVEFRTGVELCRDLKLPDLMREFDAVFLGIGLDATPSLRITGEEHILDGLDYVEQSKIDPSRLQCGNNVVVIGAGNTAIDCATIAKRLGAAKVTIVYRRSAEEVSAYQHEVDFVRNEGVEFQFLTQPARVVLDEERVTGIECLQVTLGGLDASGRPFPVPVPGSAFVVPADLIIKAIGQQKQSLPSQLGLRTNAGYVEVTDKLETNLPNVYAGGDCVRAAGTCSTVMAVQDGKLAALAIHSRLETQ